MNTLSPPARWQFWIDRSGTFTDIVARCPDGVLLTHKLLSENAKQNADAALAGIRDLLSVARDAPIPADQIAAVKMGTTVATEVPVPRIRLRRIRACRASLVSAKRPRRPQRA